MATKLHLPLHFATNKPNRHFLGSTIILFQALGNFWKACEMRILAGKGRDWKDRRGREGIIFSLDLSALSSTWKNKKKTRRERDDRGKKSGHVEIKRRIRGYR
ncbi:hypothetical protein ElyMa_005987900 [Elysia marginata]|uniref:Uncharacterized protein n=1 Tax=Elysia marginata TaxID=1093978 RepID=A0AAV4GG11_9GAST|nr:hypothetical protein ElyMa_005987900 [Elysia marginata]